MRTNSPAASAPGPASTNAASEGLHDIVGPVPISSLLEQLLLWGIVAIVLALAAWAFLRWRRLRNAALVAPPPPPPVPPHDRARRRLEAALRLIGDPDAFCTELSDILRVYLEERFGWNAPDRTTEEFLAELQRHEGLSTTLQGLLGDFLTRCDFVKFARYEPTEIELRQLHHAAARLVEDTVPPPLPPNAGSPATPASPPATP